MLVFPSAAYLFAGKLEHGGGFPTARLAQYQQAVTMPDCVEEGTGIMIGDNIANFALQNCATGEFFSLHDYCGQVKTVWMILVAGWCSACAQYLPAVIQTLDENPGLPLALMVVLGENTSGGKPTLQYCEQYAATPAYVQRRLVW